MHVVARWLALLVVTPWASGCSLVFPLDAVAADAPAIPCTPGEVATFEGELQTSAAVAGTLIAGYREASGALAVREIDGTGQPQLARDLSGTGDSLRIFADRERATITLNTSEVTGWQQIISTSMAAGELEAVPARRTPTGVHSTRAAAIASGSSFVLAFRREPGGAGSFELAIALFDASWGEVELDLLPIDLGNPVAFAPTTTGQILQTSLNLVALDGDRNVIATAATAGFDEISLVRDTPADAPGLVRTSGGAIELVALDQEAGVIGTDLVVTGREAIGRLSAQHTAAGSLVIWQESGGAFALRTSGATSPRAIEITGTQTFPFAIYDGLAGPLAVFERDGVASREVVITQLCDL